MAWPGWAAIHKSARDNCIREYLRHRGASGQTARSLRAYWRERALANAKEWRAAAAVAKPQEDRHERAA